MSIKSDIVQDRPDESRAVSVSRNRLWGSIVYLSGSIDACPNGGAPWRNQITPLLNKMGIIVLDPLKKPIDIGLESTDFREERAIWKKNGEFDKLSEVMKKVRNSDLRFVDISGFTIVCLDLSIPVCGTMEEIFLFNRQKKPIVIWCPQGKKCIPDWMFGVINHNFFFNSMQEVLEYLDYVNKSEKPETLGRWLVIDYKKLYSQIGVFNDGRSS